MPRLCSDSWMAPMCCIISWASQLRPSSPRTCPRDGIHAHPTHFYLFAGREDAHELSPMSTAGRPPGHHLVPFGDLLLHGVGDVGERRVVRSDDLLDILRSAPQLRVAGSVADVIGGQ